MERACRDLGIGPSTFYRWKSGKENTNGRPGPEGPDEYLVEIMKKEAENLFHGARRTAGTESMYDDWRGLIPRRIIAEAIEEGCRHSNLKVQESYIRYEFTEPGVAWSVDFVDVPVLGRALRVQDDRSRFMHGMEHRRTWSEADTSRVVAHVMQAAPKPLFLKHDWGGEFRSGIFQSMLRGAKVIPLPNPPASPWTNGKNERRNRVFQDWLRALKPDELTAERVAEELQTCWRHVNTWPMEALGRRSPEEVEKSSSRTGLDRDAFYREWEAVRRQLQDRSDERCDKIGWSKVEWEAMRLAALAILRRHNLVVYRRGLEAPEV